MKPGRGVIIGLDDGMIVIDGIRGDADGVSD